tara:strand:+ start:349 stop:561 length:213 start_codon:yes stop_codon:yes gene_type:complete
VGVDTSGEYIWNTNVSFWCIQIVKVILLLGACLTFGHGSVLSLSSKQKINTRSSTEGELFTVDKAMMFVI